MQDTFELGKKIAPLASPKLRQMTTNIDSKHTVLYADDDTDDLELVKEVFHKHSRNVDIVCVNNGLQAVEFLESFPDDQNPPCLIILDINMPRLNGKQALERIRKMNRFENSPVILFTTSTHPLDKSFAEKYNAGFITKPIDYTQMHMIADIFLDHCAEDIRKAIRKPTN